MIPASVDIFDAEVMHQNNPPQALPYSDSHPRPYFFVQLLRSDTFRVEVIFNHFDPFPFSANIGTIIFLTS
jgi:hypothetical protein